MIDKIEVISERGNGFGKQFKPIEQELRGNPRFASFRPSKHYLAVGDLRPFGFDAIMHLEQRRYGTSKLELLDTGAKKLGEMCSTVEELLDGDPLKHRVSRIDLCADVAGVALTWFRDHIRVKRKQWLAEFSQESKMGKKFYGTYYWGKRPSCLRVYDKVAERKIEFDRWCKRTLREERRTWAKEQAITKPEDRRPLFPTELPEFLQWLAVEIPISQQDQEHYPVVTRVENQMGGRVPENLSSLHLVKRNAQEFDPFAGLELIPGRGEIPNPLAKDASGKLNFEPMQYVAGLGIRELFKTWGAQQAWNFLDRQRNGARILETYGDFIPDTGEPGITPGALRDRYQASTALQLAA